jgi:hypothetical protein
MAGGKKHRCKLDGCQCHQFAFSDPEEPEEGFSDSKAQGSPAYTLGYKDGKAGIVPETFASDSREYRVAYWHGHSNGEKSREGNS